MEPARESDEQLMGQVADGRHEPLSVLLRRYASPLLTFIRRMNGDHHQSEELFQEVFLAVWNGRRKYRFPEPFRAWLFAIAANKCRAEYRRASRTPLILDTATTAVASGREPTPPDCAVATETAALVEKAVLGLPAQQRSVVVLRIWNGFSFAEIARVLGRRESTVRSNMFHALAALRRYLEPRMQ